MQKNFDMTAVIAVAAFLLIISGGLIVSLPTAFHYSSSIYFDGDVVSYEVESASASGLNVVVMRNGDFRAVGKLYLYYDENIPSVNKKIDELDAIISIEEELRRRSFTDFERIDAFQLGLLIGSLDPAGTGVFIASGSLPYTVYSDIDWPIIDWMQNGGALYWAGGLLGMYYSSADGVHVSALDYQRLFFGSTGVLRAPEMTVAPIYGEIISGDPTLNKALSVSVNDTTFGVKGIALATDVKHLSMGFSADGYDSISFVQKGAGMITVFGGFLHWSTYRDAAQLIAAGISYDSELVENIHTVVSVGRTSGPIGQYGRSNVSVYLYLGGIEAIYGKLHSLP
ncbi:MAG: hypothetical protein LBV63_02390 [Candidatus Methanoplasma sp.]|nr:hypothetical protein [Candidatus Methanoplasma sp.]